MDKKYNILVFPCGSEIGLEIHRSLRYSIHINLIGASSIADHGKFVYNNYIDNIPFINDPQFIPVLKKIVKEYSIDAIYPAMDSVITQLSLSQSELGCKIIASPANTTEICLSKKKTYECLKGLIKVPKIFKSIESITQYPVFMKPDIGYGSRGARPIHTRIQAEQHLLEYPNAMILENLQGDEYTVDCFTNFQGKLLFSKPRIRRRIYNGISVNTVPIKERLSEFEEIANKINNTLSMRGGWFYQVKENKSHDLILLEIASRLGGSSSLYRNIGVNFALLSVFDAFEHPIKISYNDYEIELDRALDNRYKLNIHFKRAYIDFDDCLLIEDQVNTQLLKLLFQFLNNKIELILITKHDRDIKKTLRQHRLADLFDEIVHLHKDDEKTNYINPEGSIFIDDSFLERHKVHQAFRIPVFAPDNIECLLEN